VVEQLGRRAVVAALELELGVVEQGVDVRGADAGRLAEVLEVGSLVCGAELLDRGLVGEEGDDGVGVGLIE
jgi:hypothetical protein